MVVEVDSDSVISADKADMKLGMFGAPPCRLTSLVLAIGLALIGLVLAGAGGCITGFSWSDETPQVLGIALVVVGIIAMIAGLSLYLWDVRIAKRVSRAQEDIGENSMSSQQGNTTLAARPRQGQRQQPTIPVINEAVTRDIDRSSTTDEAPPPYDDVLDTTVNQCGMSSKVNYCQSRDCSTPTIRPSYDTVIRNAYAMTTAV